MYTSGNKQIPMKLFRKVVYLTDGFIITGIFNDETERQRTLWRTHLVVCRRCKAKAESLRQTDGDAYIKPFFSCVAVLSGLHFLIERKKEGNQYAR